MDPLGSLLGVSQLGHSGQVCESAENRPKQWTRSELHVSGYQPAIGWLSGAASSADTPLITELAKRAAMEEAHRMGGVLRVSDVTHKR
jgi:hypothetical protein